MVIIILLTVAYTVSTPDYVNTFFYKPFQCRVRLLLQGNETFVNCVSKTAGIRLLTLAYTVSTLKSVKGYAFLRVEMHF